MRTSIKNLIVREIKGLWGDDPIEGQPSTSVIKTNDLSYEGDIDFSNITRRNIDLEKAKENYLQPGDLLIEKSGGTKDHSVGYVDYFDGGRNTYVCNNFILTIRPDSSIVIPKFLFYALKFLYENGAFSDCYNKTTGIQNLKCGSYLEKEINVPSLEEQKSIVKTLDCVVSCIDGSKHQLLLLDEEIESQFDKMFKVEKNVRNIGEIASICRGASPRPISQFITDEPSGVNWIKIGDVETNAIYITKTAEKITQEAAKKSRFVKPGDFILSNSMSFGRPYILKIAGCVHDGWLILSNYQNMLLPLYFYYALRSNFVQEQFERNAAGSTVRNLNSNIVRKCKVIVPPMESQIVFSSFVDKAEKAKSDIRIKEALFEELFANRCHQFFETEA